MLFLIGHTTQKKKLLFPLLISLPLSMQAYFNETYSPFVKKEKKCVGFSYKRKGKMF